MKTIRIIDTVGFTTPNRSAIQSENNTHHLHTPRRLRLPGIVVFIGPSPKGDAGLSFRAVQKETALWPELLSVAGHLE